MILFQLISYSRFNGSLLMFLLIFSLRNCRIDTVQGCIPSLDLRTYTYDVIWLIFQLL